MILQIDIVLNRYRGIIKLRAYRYRVFLQRTPHDRNLPQAKLLNRSNSFFFCLKGRGPLKKVKNNAEM